MSVSLGIYKGKRFDIFASQFIADVPVSFQTVWDNVWLKEYLSRFYQEHKDEDYWFDLG